MLARFGQSRRPVVKVTHTMLWECCPRKFGVGASVQRPARPGCVLARCLRTWSKPPPPSQGAISAESKNIADMQNCGGLTTSGPWCIVYGQHVVRQKARRRRLRTGGMGTRRRGVRRETGGARAPYPAPGTTPLEGVRRYRGGSGAQEHAGRRRRRDLPAHVRLRGYCSAQVGRPPVLSGVKASLRFKMVKTEGGQAGCDKIGDPLRPSSVAWKIHGPCPDPRRPPDGHRDPTSRIVHINLPGTDS